MNDVRRHSLDLVVVVALFCVYTVCALTLCVIGVQIYQSTADTMRKTYDDRTSVLYVAEKIRHNDLEGCVRIDRVNGADALVLTEKKSGRDYETWLFVQDGVLYEGLFAPGAPLDINLCQPILPMESMTLDISAGASPAGGQLLSVSFVTVDGHINSIDLWLRAARESGA